MGSEIAAFAVSGAGTTLFRARGHAGAGVPMPEHVPAAERESERAMKEYVYVVRSNPVTGREDEYNRWYSERHLADVMAVPGFVSARRYRIDRKSTRLNSSH